MTSFKKKSRKTAKGYRLKPETHKLINKLCELLEADQDEVISKACRKIYKEVSKTVIE
jgi:hypothetical protein